MTSTELITSFRLETRYGSTSARIDEGRRKEVETNQIWSIHHIEKIGDKCLLP
jgi:hypothetical protein